VTSKLAFAKGREAGWQGAASMEPDNKSPGMLIARLDRIPIWSLPGLFIGIIGVGFLFTFYDIFDINVSFIQTCTQIVPHCTPPSAANYIGLPVLLNLVGYSAP
jgi:MFS transporter, putative metabolite:H+ symporter